MQQLSFKNRIAFNYIFSTALLILFVFVLIYYIVSYTVYEHVDSGIKSEVSAYISEITVVNNNISLIDKEEWKEREHNTLNVNPVFIQVYNAKKVVIDKSPNLKLHQLTFDNSKSDFENFDSFLVGKAVRQTQFAMRANGRIAGYVLIAMSLEDAKLVLFNLSKTLIISFPVILVLLFFSAQFIAGRNISPIQAITQTASNITQENLSSRILLPQKKDELYVLSKTINDLLERIEKSIIREKQFTSDASHEFRTPLAVIKGTLEVLIRKPRDTAEYQQKITYCIREVDRLNNLVDQLLLLARFENHKLHTNLQVLNLDEIILQSLQRFSIKIAQSNIAIDFRFDAHFPLLSDDYLVSIVIENLLSNALKYSGPGSKIQILLSKSKNSTICKIIDSGIGIAEEDLHKIYDQFFRSEASLHSEIKGSGLGLSIVKRICDLLQVAIQIDSVPQKGTTVVLRFPN